jgi:tRNA(His) 5'-end guanylyltransferase
MSIEDITNHIRLKEAEYDYTIPEDRWIVVRLDGRGFSSLTEQHFTKPFDDGFHALMLHTASSLLTQLEGVYCYTGSDEISLILPPNWSMFDRRLEKIVSISASIASSSFTLASAFKHKFIKVPSQFDSRAVALSSIDEVIQYYLWRIVDVRRCAIHTAIYWTLRQSGMSPTKVTKTLNGMSWQEKDKMLQQQFSIKFSDIPLWKQQGIGIYWETYQKTGYNPIKNEDVIAERRRTSVTDVRLGDNHKTWLYNILQESLA